MDLEDDDIPRSLGIGISILAELGFGGLLRGRIGPVGLEFSATVAPEYFVTTGTACPVVVFEFPFRMTASVIGYVYEDREVSHSFRAGAIWNQIYQYGGIVGYRAEVRVLDWLTLDGGTGFIFMPLGHEHATGALQSRCGPEAKPSPTSELTNRVWLYFGVGMTAYLF